MAPSARGRGRACARRRNSGSAAIATAAPGSAPIATSPAAAMVASFALAIFPTNIFWPSAATIAITNTAASAARIPAATARSCWGSSRRSPQPGGRAPVIAWTTSSAARPQRIAAVP